MVISCNRVCWTGYRLLSLKYKYKGPYNPEAEGKEVLTTKLEVTVVSIEIVNTI